MGTSFFAFRLSGDVIAYQMRGFEFRGGLSMGYYSLKSSVPEISATVNIIPLLPYAKANYLPDIKALDKFGKLIPFVALGFGSALVSLDEKINFDIVANSELRDTSKSNFEAMLNLAWGASFNPRALPSMEFGLIFHYFMIFEKRNTSFFSFSLGATYRL